MSYSQSTETAVLSVGENSGELLRIKSTLHLSNCLPLKKCVHRKTTDNQAIFLLWRWNTLFISTYVSMVFISLCTWQLTRKGHRWKKIWIHVFMIIPQSIKTKKKKNHHLVQCMLDDSHFCRIHSAHLGMQKKSTKHGSFVR